jgi:hypothetical protein
MDALRTVAGMALLGSCLAGAVFGSKAEVTGMLVGVFFGAPLAFWFAQQEDRP